MLIVHPCQAVKDLCGVFLIDRNLDFFQLDSGNSRLAKFCKDFAGNGPTLLDGEIVTTPHFDASEESFFLGVGVPSFMVFDIVVCQGVNLHDEPLSARESAVLERISSRFATLEREWRNSDAVKKCHSSDWVYFPVFINRKKLFPLSEMGQLSQFLQPLDGKRMYIEKDGSGKLKRYHLSDGLVFTHQGPYSSRLFKWKYPELVSVDFVLIRSERAGVIEFYLKGDVDNGLVRVRTTSEQCVENEEDLKRALVVERNADPNDPLSRLEMQHEPLVVAELTFNRSSGMWSFHRLCAKRMPNHVTVGVQTMEHMMETPLEIGELVSLFRTRK
jgi:hypothetical protein